MRVLIINKFLYPNGGSETYIFKLGEALEQHGHEVQYFGMEHEGRCVGNRVNAYTSDMDFHGGSKLSKLTYPIKTIYSKEAREKLRLVLDDFQPDVCHLNNFNYQLTPSIILEIVKWRKETGRECKIIFTAHDYQLVCPNHMLNNPNTHQNCEKCLGGHFANCMKGKCIHGSTAKSAIGMMEAEFWKWKGTYKYIDTMICCSEFMKSKMDSNPLFATKTVAMHNFIDKVEWKETEKKDYVLYFGRFSEEKGIGTLIKVCKELPDVQFIFAGTGPLEETVNGIKNIKNVGFQKGEALEKLIREARFSIYPSEWYENCPFSVMESQMYGTPVLGANIGGIPELIQVGKTGELFESGNGKDLKEKIEKLWGDKKLCEQYSKNCIEMSELEKRLMKHIDLLVERYPSLESEKNSIISAYLLLEECYVNGGKLLVAGNGGSAADAEHIVGELMKGFKMPRKPRADFAEKLMAENQELGTVLAENLQGALPAIALDGHPALSTAYMNDCEPLLCFAQQVNGYGKVGDVFLGISTSGNSKNVLYAATTAHAKGMKVIGLTGAKSSKLEQMSDVCIKVPQTETYMIQEFHLPVYHCLCLMLEDKFFGEC